MSEPTPTTSPATASAARPAQRVRSPLREAWRRTMRRPQAILGAFSIGSVLLLGLLAPVVSAVEGQDPSTFHSELLNAANGGVPRGAFGGASSVHWLGVEPSTGRDLFSLIAYGTRTSIGIALAATAIAVVLGALVGLLMGYLGGVVEAVLSRFVDFMFGFPSLLFLISLQLIVSPDFPRPVLLALVLGLFGWVGTARLIHGQTRQITSREYIEAARASGTPTWRILTREVLPNIVGTLVVVVALSFPATVGAGAGLSFLGVGVGPTTPELGRLIGASVTWTYTGADVWYLIFPGAVLLLLVLGATLLGDALRDAFDVRLSGDRA